MNPNDADPEDDLASLSQEATNESTPDKALDEDQPVRQRKVAPNRTKAPNSD